jgi:hypothetical protein
MRVVEKGAKAIRRHCHHDATHCHCIRKSAFQALWTSLYGGHCIFKHKLSLTLSCFSGFRVGDAVALKSRRY